MAAATKSGLKLVHPDRVEYAGKEVKVGRVGHALLALVIARRMSAKMADAGPAVYGLSEVSRARIDTSCSRVNDRLEEVGCPLRLAVDSGRVVLV